MRPILLVIATALTFQPALAAQRPDSLSITVDELAGRLRFLSSDLFEGRGPGTRGEALATAYLISELETFGVRPGAANGWLQPVSIVTHQPAPEAPIAIGLSGRVTRALEHGRDIRLANYTAAPEVDAGGELVFVGYGIDAPIYQWNDFASVDLHGKVAVVLLGEPRITNDSARFDGRRASRYSDFFEKTFELERRGAVGMVVIRPAGSLQKTPPSGPSRLAARATSGTLRFIGGITDSVLATLLPTRPRPRPRSSELGALIQRAGRPGFRAVPLGVRLDVKFHTRPTTVVTHNVVGVVPGTDSSVAAEHVVLSAHWDHLGIGAPVNGDSIYNGALDDGSGITALLALSRVFAHHPQRRSLTLLFTTAEEWGLLGAEAFACSGPLPPERIVANLNMDDGTELAGRSSDVAPLGGELSTLGRVIEDEARRKGLKVSPDPYPQEGFFLRADNFSFARAGIPALYMALGLDAEGQPAGTTKARMDTYLAKHYHQPSDEYDTVVVDPRGSQQFAEFVRDVTIAVANATERPEWLRDAEFSRAVTATACPTRSRP
jgi:peptidase M28-like protein